MSRTDKPSSCPINSSRWLLIGNRHRMGEVVCGRNRDPKLYIFKCDGSRDSGIREAGGDGYLVCARGEIGIPSEKEVCRCSCGCMGNDAIGL